MAVALDILELVLFLFLMLLFGRVAISIVILLARDWKPRGFWLLLTETCLTVTDPPVKFLRSFVPELSFGSVRLDLSILLLFVGCSLALQVVRAL